MCKDTYLRCEHYARLFYDCRGKDKSCDAFFLKFLQLYSCHRYGFRY